MSSNNGTASFIPDGYTQNVYFRELSGIHGEFRGRCRPLIMIQQGQVQRELQLAEDDWEKRQWIAARWITQQFVDWNVKQPGGQPVDHKDINQVIRLRPALFNRLWAVLNNQDGGDVDPQQTPYEAFARAQREQAVAATGPSKSVEQVLEGN